MHVLFLTFLNQAIRISAFKAAYMHDYQVLL